MSVFGLLILQKKSKRTSDYLLLALEVLIAIMLLTDIQLREAVLAWSFFVYILIPYLLISIFALYIQFLFSPKRKFKPKDILYFVPAILASLLVFRDQWVNGYSLSRLDELCHFPNTFYILTKIGYQVYSLAILVPVLIRINKYQESLKDRLSYIDPFQLKWLWHFTWIYFAIISITMVAYGLFAVGILTGSLAYTHLFVSICMVVGVCLCCYKGIRQYSWEFFKYAQLAEDSLAEEPEESKTAKYEHSSLKEEEMNNIYEALLSLFEDQEIYLQPKLCVQDLANELKVTPHILSQTLNLKTGQTFYDFVNGYRVEHLKELLKDPANAQYTILALGLESGFNSKASLNRIFKNHTGKTPSAFQGLHIQNGYSSNHRHSLG